MDIVQQRRRVSERLSLGIPLRKREGGRGRKNLSFILFRHLHTKASLKKRKEKYFMLKMFHLFRSIYLLNYGQQKNYKKIASDQSHLKPLCHFTKSNNFKINFLTLKYQIRPQVSLIFVCFPLPFTLCFRGFYLVFFSPI